MKALLSILMVALTCLFIGCATPPKLTSRETALQDVVDFWVKDIKCPECSVAYVSSEGVRFAGDPDRMYRIASLSKIFFELAILDLQRQGKIDLDKSVRDCSPYSLPEEYASVKLRDCLHHRTGLPREFMHWWNPVDAHRAFMCGLFGTDIYTGFQDRKGFEERANRSSYRKLVRESAPHYSNMGFVLLTTAVEHLLKQPIEEWTANYLQSVGSFPHTTFHPSSEQEPYVTKSCAGMLPWLVRKGSEVDPHPLGDALRGSGGLLASVRESCEIFARYRREVLATVLADGAKVAALKEGEMVGQTELATLPSGRRALCQFGFIYGGQTFLAYDTQSDSFVVFFRNVTTWPADEDYLIADRLFSLFNAGSSAHAELRSIQNVGAPSR